MEISNEWVYMAPRTVSLILLCDRGMCLISQHLCLVQADAWSFVLCLCLFAGSTGSIKFTCRFYKALFLNVPSKVE
jgi:hypothetical protein